MSFITQPVLRRELLEPRDELRTITQVPNLRTSEALGRMLQFFGQSCAIVTIDLNVGTEEFPVPAFAEFCALRKFSAEHVVSVSVSASLIGDLTVFPLFDRAAVYHHVTSWAELVISEIAGYFKENRGRFYVVKDIVNQLRVSEDEDLIPIPPHQSQ